MEGPQGSKRRLCDQQDKKAVRKMGRDVKRGGETGGGEKAGGQVMFAEKKQSGGKKSSAAIGGEKTEVQVQG